LREASSKKQSVDDWLELIEPFDWECENEEAYNVLICQTGIHGKILLPKSTGDKSKQHWQHK